jgi:hypothetical protein
VSEGGGLRRFAAAGGGWKPVWAVKGRDWGVNLVETRLLGPAVGT